MEGVFNLQRLRSQLPAKYATKQFPNLTHQLTSTEEYSAPTDQSSAGPDHAPVPQATHAIPLTHAHQHGQILRSGDTFLELEQTVDEPAPTPRLRGTYRQRRRQEGVLAPGS